MIRPDDLIACARSWVGVKFQHQGRSRFGCDCMGGLAAQLAEVGSTVLLDHLPKAYPRIPGSLLVDGLHKLCRPVDLQPGAIVLIKFPLSRYPSHAGIYTGQSMIHCNQMVGRVTEHAYADPWTRRTVGIFGAPYVEYRSGPSAM